MPRREGSSAGRALTDGVWMPDERPEPFPQRALVELFAHDELDDARQREAERVLEQSEAARELFRQLTAGRYPRLPNYTIIGQIGKGGFGVVYKAVHHDKERVEALKVLFSKTPLLTEYFQNEVHLIARLRHQNIATLFEAQLSTPPLYYTMEFVEGERLNDYLKKYTVSLAERIRIIRTVAAAIEYAHAQGVVHRDLKPQNILIDDAGQPHVVDFGIAKKLALTEVRPPRAEDTSHESHEGPVGTLGYIAPEQEKGGPVDARADIFALVGLRGVSRGRPGDA
jgi:serine/threonine protein kinase